MCAKHVTYFPSAGGLQYSLCDAHQRPSRCMEDGQEAATLMLRGRQASLVRLIPSLCTGMVNTMAVPRCWLALGCKASCCTCCGSHSAGSCVQTLLAAVCSSLQTRQGSCRGFCCRFGGHPSVTACAQTLLPSRQTRAEGVLLHLLGRPHR